MARGVCVTSHLGLSPRLYFLTDQAQPGSPAVSRTLQTAGAPSTHATACDRGLGQDGVGTVVADIRGARAPTAPSSSLHPGGTEQPKATAGVQGGEDRKPACIVQPVSPAWEAGLPLWTLGRLGGRATQTRSLAESEQGPHLEYRDLECRGGAEPGGAAAGGKGAGV